MNLSKALLLSVSLFSAAAFADNQQGRHRVGLGYSSTDIAGWDGNSNTDWGDGLRLEYGYEFNHIVGINLSYSENSDTERVDGIKADIDGYDIKVDADIGYNFDLDGFSVKPYGLIGLARHSEIIPSATTVTN